MECNSSEPVTKKIKIDSHESILPKFRSKADETGQEICANNITWPPSCPSREMPPLKPRAILHDKYYASLKTGQCFRTFLLVFASLCENCELFETTKNLLFDPLCSCSFHMCCKRSKTDFQTDAVRVALYITFFGVQIL